MKRGPRVPGGAVTGNWRAAVQTPARRRWMAAHRLVSAKVAASILGVTPNRIRQLAKTKQLRAAVVDDGYCGIFIFARTDVERFAQARAAKRLKVAA